MNIRHNTITDCGASSGQIILLGNAAKCTVERNSVSFTTPVTSHFVYLYNGGTSNTINVLDNTLRGISYCATVDGSHATTTSTNRCRGNIGAAANSMASWTGATAVTGARGGNAAMASLLTALAASGLIVNSTTA
ncbi:MAG: hypothetical protein H7X95_00515 [Deltaproteobacteria bacterium]|nr:hypothetical protein [Deltaproteobacteria bacterium]